ncbi:MAG: hypothetical protein RMM08_00220 [Armatimonadota bacterium]|nr:C39 family peptidase [bacterium]MDW8319759.1 hypothetical protein [Armatimonadota bacterium]
MYLQQLMVSVAAATYLLALAVTCCGQGAAPVVIQVTPPEQEPRLLLTFTTGGDDLRGGNDNLTVVVVTSDGTQKRFDNVNRSQRWADRSVHTVELPLGTTSADQLEAIRLEVSFTGGIAGDNWNMDRIVAQFREPAARGGRTTTLIERSGAPLFRFTGDARVLQLRLKPGTAPIRVRPVMTPFNPSQHGFKFANFFKIPTNIANITVAGLCGGMSYSALDYYNARTPVPNQPYMPAPGSPLGDYILARQFESVRANMDKWTEVGVNPGGARNAEFFRWGLQPGSGRMGELRYYIDRNTPVVLGLWPVQGDFFNAHQVVAIGYDLGRYYGDPNEFAEDFKIFIYDPNHPNQTIVMRPDLRNGWFYYENDPQKRWRTYFVDSKYRAQRPPATGTPPANEIWAHFKTGGDDLRGGNDNVHMVLLLRNGREIRFNDVNRRQRWIDHSRNDFAAPLPNDVRREDIVGVRLETTFGGGIGGDNWNLDELHLFVRFGTNSGWTPLIEQRGSPLFRFTGDHRTREWRF